jgi:hypothetical protein
LSQKLASGSIVNVVLARLVPASSIVNDVLGTLLGSTWLTVSFVLWTTAAIASTSVHHGFLCQTFLEISVKLCSYVNGTVLGSNFSIITCSYLGLSMTFPQRIGVSHQPFLMPISRKKLKQCPWGVMYFILFFMHLRLLLFLILGNIQLMEARHILDLMFTKRNL